MNRKAARNESLPQGWERKRIIDFSPLQRGYDLPSSQIEKGQYPVVYSNGIKNYHSKFKACPPGVVTGRSGTIGKVIYVETNYWPHNTSLWVTDFKGNFPKFVFYALERLQLDKYDAGSGVPTLNRNDVHKQFVLVPPLPEQKAIVSLLETWDAAIEKTEALIIAKEKRFRWLLKAIISDQQDKPEWKKVPLDEIVKIRKEKYRPVDTKRLRCIELENIEKETARLIGETESNQSLSTKYIFRRGDILFGKLRPNLRKFALPNFDGVCSSEIWVMCPDLEIADNRYFFYLIQSERFVNAACKTTGSRMPRADWSILKKLVFKVPSLTEQRTIASLLDTCSTEIEKNRRLIQYYQSQKRGLMQKLLTGSWRVIA